MKITAIFTESRPKDFLTYAEMSGKRVEILSHDPFDNTFRFSYKTFEGFAFAHELTESSHPLNLFVLKQRVLGQ